MGTQGDLGMQAKFVDIGGIPTRYLRAGAGYPVLLLHGVGMAADSWIENITELASEFDVYAPDMLGCGFTPLYGAGGSVPTAAPQLAMVDHLSAFIDHLELDKFAIVGSSLGGLIAALQYFAMPDRVDSITFAGSAAMYAADKAELKEIFAGSFKNGSMAYANISLDTLRQRLGNIVHDPSVIPDYVLHTQMTTYALPWSFAAYQYRMQGMLDALDADDAGWISHRLDEIAVPALAIAGDEDPRTTAAWEEQAVRGISDARRVEFSKCGHLPHLEYPGKFNRLITEFVSDSRPT